jgi:hypothetical protein
MTLCALENLRKHKALIKGFGNPQDANDIQEPGNVVPHIFQNEGSIQQIYTMTYG